MSVSASLGPALVPGSAAAVGGAVVGAPTTAAPSLPPMSMGGLGKALAGVGGGLLPTVAGGAGPAREGKRAGAGRRVPARLLQYLRRLVRVSQMDFELALWQMVHVLFSQQRAYVDARGAPSTDGRGCATDHYLPGWGAGTATSTCTSVRWREGGKLLTSSSCAAVAVFVCLCVYVCMCVCMGGVVGVGGMRSCRNQEPVGAG
jgi:hypothetical protein